MWYIFKMNKVHKKLIINKSLGSFNCDFIPMSRYSQLFSILQLDIMSNIMTLEKNLRKINMG
jgi:hypothetical protein